MRMKKKTALLTALLLLGGLVGCGQQEGSADEQNVPELLEPVDVKMDMARAQMGEIYQVATYNGEVVPYTEELHFLVDGNLEDIYVTVGDMVQEGQVLAALSEERTAEQAEELEEEIEHLVRQGEFSDRLAGVDIEIAREELQHLHDLGEFGYTSRVKELELQELELALEQVRELRNLELQHKQNTLKTLKDKLGKNEIKAPYAGRIVYIANVKNGDAIQGYAPVLYIADESRLSLSTEYISESTIEYADKVYARIMDREYDISYVPMDTAELVKLALTGAEMKARFSINTEDDTLVAGQFAVIMVYSAYRENVLVIPINALYRDGSGQYVYKQVDGARVRCDVKTGMVTDTKAEIVEGLAEGDWVYVKD